MDMYYSIRILIIEDSESDARLLKEYLRELDPLYEIESCSTAQAAFNHLNEKQYSAIFLDLFLPDSVGTDTIESIYTRAPDTPIIVLTGFEQEVAGVLALRRGAQDYISKNNLNKSLLQKSLEYAIERCKLQQRLFKIIENSVDAIFVVNAENKLVYCNHAAKNISEESPFSESITAIAKSLDLNTPKEISLQFGLNDYRTYNARKTQFEWGEQDTFFIFLHDVSELKKAQNILERHKTELKKGIEAQTKKLKLTNLYLKTLSDCNRAVHSVEDESLLVSEVNHLLTERHDFPISGILFLNNYNYASHIASQDKHDVLFKMIALASHAESTQKLLTELNNQTLFYCKVETLNYNEDVIGHLHEYQCTHQITLPLVSSGKIIGLIILFTNKPAPPEQDEQNFLSNLAADVSHGIESIRLQKEREKLHQQLQQSQKMEAIGQLTGGIAHDFNNILATVLGYTDLLLHRRDINQQTSEEYLRLIQAAGNRARDLVAQMLAFSRSSPTNIGEHELPLIVDESLRLLKSTLPSSIAISTEYADDIHQLRVDPTQINQLILNTCINARDAMEGQGEIHIDITPKHINNLTCNSCFEKFNGDFIAIRVKDTGSGIEPRIQQRIFDPFFSTKDVGKGTGMGLSSVHGIVHNHDGHILLDSAVGEGTTFTFLFPNNKATQAQASLDSESHPSKAKKSISVVIVDDEKAIAHLLGELIETWGHTTTIFTESKKCVEYVLDKSNAIDVLITDQTMPGLTGLDIVRSLRQARPLLPIILCTGYSEQVTPSAIKESAILEVLHKPIDVECLKKAILTVENNETVDFCAQYQAQEAIRE